MTVAYPWSGRDVNGRVPLSGRAAVHVPSGAGFNWRSVAGHSSGWVMPRGLRGLGQDPTSGAWYNAGTDGSVVAGDGASTTVLGAPWSTLGTPTDSSTASTSSATTGGGVPTWLQNIIGGWSTTGQKVLLQQTSPLQQVVSKGGTYYQTPQGLVYATGSAGATGILGASNVSSYLPILLIGGLGLVLMMGMMRR